MLGTGRGPGTLRPLDKAQTAMGGLCLEDKRAFPRLNKERKKQKRSKKKKRSLIPGLYPELLSHPRPTDEGTFNRRGGTRKVEEHVGESSRPLRFSRRTHNPATLPHPICVPLFSIHNLNISSHLFTFSRRILKSGYNAKILLSATAHAKQKMHIYKPARQSSIFEK